MVSFPRLVSSENSHSTERDYVFWLEHNTGKCYYVKYEAYSALWNSLCLFFGIHTHTQTHTHAAWTDICSILKVIPNTLYIYAGVNSYLMDSQPHFDPESVDIFKPKSFQTQIPSCHEFFFSVKNHFVINHFKYFYFFHLKAKERVFIAARSLQNKDILVFFFLEGMDAHSGAGYQAERRLK